MNLLLQVAVILLRKMSKYSFRLNFQMKKKKKKKVTVAHVPLVDVVATIADTANLFHLLLVISNTFHFTFHFVFQKILFFIFWYF